MAKDIYKKERKISSVEELQKNVKTMNPGIWILITAILAFLLGMIVFICTTTYSSTLPVAAYSYDGIVYYYVKEENFSSVRVGQKVTYSDSDTVDTIADLDATPLNTNFDIITEDIKAFGGYTDGIVYECASGESDMAPGYHEAYIYLEEYSLIESFFN